MSAVIPVQPGAQMRLRRTVPSDESLQRATSMQHGSSVVRKQAPGCQEEQASPVLPLASAEAQSDQVLVGVCGGETAQPRVVVVAAMTWPPAQERSSQPHHG